MSTNNFLITGNPQNIPKLKGGPNMFYTATAEQIEQLYPELITLNPEKTRFFYQDPKINKKRLVDRIFGYYFSDKPWGLEQEYLTEGINQQFTNEDDLLSLNIRNSIKAPDGWTFVAEDYAAEELRLNAINTGCKAMMKAFVNGLDVHTETARAMFGEEELAKNKKYCRTKAKFFEFGCCYGGSWRVAQQKGEPDEEAQANYEKFKLAWSDMFSVQDQQVRASHQTLSEHSFFGFPVRLHRYYGSQNYKDVNAGERLAKNHRIQSSGADILSIAFIRLWNNIFNNPQLSLKLDVLEYIKYQKKFNETFDETRIQEIVQSNYIPYEGYKSQMENYIRFQLTVHDEIDFIIRTELLEILIPEITKCMTVQMPDWKIPVNTGLSIGPTFGALYEWEYDTKENGYKVLHPGMEPEKKKEPKKEEPKQEVLEERVEISF